LKKTISKREGKRHQATVYQGTNLFALQAERIEWIERSDSKSSGRYDWLKNYSASIITLLQPCKSPEARVQRQEARGKM